MRLKTIELFGFKSFVEKTTLNFDANIIALVGPNGCGKSNIVDAMLWVLGEQSAKSLRAEKMHDLLFAGAEGFKAAHYAEVSLTFSDVDHLGFGPEMTVTRRFYRDGEMLYLINRKEVRLKDINALFLGTGVGKSAFFVFAQGQIEEVINMSAEKKRAMFEDTAGISPFIQKKKEVASELAEVEKNYLRLNDIHGEIERQLRTLQRQAARAKSYKESKQQLETYEKAIFLFKAKSLKENIYQAEKKWEKQQEELSISEKKMILLEKSLVEWKKKEESSETEKNELQKHYFHNESSLKLSEVELQGNDEALLHIEEREKKALISREKVLQSRDIFIREKEENLFQLTKIEEEKKIIEKEKEEKEKAHILLDKELTALFSEEKKMQKMLLEMVRKESGVKNHLQEKQLKHESVIKSSGHIEKRVVELEKILSDSSKKSIQRRKEVTKISLDIEKESQEIAAMDLSVKSLLTKIKEKTGEKEKIDQEVSELSSQIKALLHLQKAHVGFSNGAKMLLKEAQDTNSALFSKVEELYKYVHFEEMSQNIASALRIYEETLVVKNRMDLPLIFDFATRKKIGNFSLVLLQDLKEEEGGISFSFLRTLSFAKNFSEAVRLCQEKRGVEVVTEEGIFIDHHGVLFYRGGKETQETSLFLRENEIKKKTYVLNLLEKTQKEITTEWELLLAQKKACDAQLLSLDEKRRKKEVSLIQENFYLQRALEDQKSACDELTKLEKERESQKKLEEDLNEDIAKLCHSSKIICEENEEIKKSQLLLEQRLQEKKKLLNEKTSENHDIKKRFDRIVSRFYSLKENIKIIDIKREEGERTFERLSLEIEEGAILKGSYLVKKKRLEEGKKIYLEEREKSRDVLLKMEMGLKEERAQKRECELEIGSEKKKIREIEKEKHHTDLLLAEKKTAFENMTRQLQETFCLNFEALKEENIALDLPLQEAEERVYRLRYELENINSINMAAISECEEQEKRFSELDAQLSDVKGAKEALQKIIAKLEQDCRRLFKTTFDAVRGHFQKNFQLLFNGGEADLTFTQEEDLLERGIEIIAKPPGKKMRSLSLLSGGEKCMTTLALLFALFAVKPAPFCILDEVDAPLDEANVMRFTSLLKEFVPKTQFIIVTHNKKTMAVSDMLVGVSMEKRGVSKLVSLIFGTKKEEKFVTIEN